MKLYTMKLPIDYENSHWTIRKRAREEYVKLQHGLCWHCKQPLSGKPSDEVLEKWINKRLFPKNFFKWPVHLHHDHKTGLTIGAVHCECNAVLWQYHELSVSNKEKPTSSASTQQRGEFAYEQMDK